MDDLPPAPESHDPRAITRAGSGVSTQLTRGMKPPQFRTVTAGQLVKRRRATDTGALRVLLVAVACPLMALGWMSPPAGFGVSMIVLAELLVFASCMIEGRVSAVGSFVFMYVLFFAVRPLYFFTEYDWTLMATLFRLPKDPALPYESLRWGALALLCFRIGSLAPGASQPPRFVRNWQHRGKQLRYVMKVADVVPLLFVQLVTLVALRWIIGRAGGLYTFGTGYVYDLPVPMQALHAFAVMFILQMVRMDRRNVLLKWALGISLALFIAFTITMRSVTLFRLFYLTGFLVLCFAFLGSRQKKVSYWWLILPIAVALPIFDVLGRARFQSTDRVGDYLSENIDNLLTPGNYWDFFEGNRDMNIFDSFTAALNYKTDKQPYFEQWLYPLVHWVPRKFWHSKPPGGILIDLDGAMHHAPYSPGINGIFYLGGGKLYMLVSMTLLGYLLARLNASILAMREGVLKWTIYGTFVVNTMLLTRFFLFQFVWQVLYVVVPVALLNYVLIKKIKLPRGRHRHPPRHPGAMLHGG